MTVSAVHGFTPPRSAGMGAGFSGNRGDRRKMGEAEWYDSLLRVNIGIR
jgi:hypothetical protein